MCIGRGLERTPSKDAAYFSVYCFSEVISSLCLAIRDAFISSAVVKCKFRPGCSMQIELFEECLFGEALVHIFQ